jgi:hypothetical protein
LDTTTQSDMPSRVQKTLARVLVQEQKYSEGRQELAAMREELLFIRDKLKASTNTPKELESLTISITAEKIQRIISICWPITSPTNNKLETEGLLIRHADSLKIPGKNFELNSFWLDADHDVVVQMYFMGSDNFSSGSSLSKDSFKWTIPQNIINLPSESLESGVRSWCVDSLRKMYDLEYDNAISAAAHWRNDKRSKLDKALLICNK